MNRFLFFLVAFNLSSFSFAALNQNEDSLIVEVEPRFPGGESAMGLFIMSNIKVPVSVTSGGTIYVEFVVEPDGSLSNIKIIQGMSDEMNSEVIRMIKLMPKWDAGMINDIAVRTRYIIPVNVTIR